MNFSCADELNQRDAGRAGERAGAAFDTGGDVVRLKDVCILESGRQRQFGRDEVHRADADAAAAADAVRLNRLFDFAVGENRDSAGSLCNRNVCRANGKTHHGTAHEDAVGFWLQTAAEFNQF